VKLLGRPAPLRQCQWVAVEVSDFLREMSSFASKVGQNQWGQFTTHPVTSQPYGRTLSTVFGGINKGAEVPNFAEDHDPSLPSLRFLNYRYIRFCYQPVEDKFSVCTSWKDPLWTSARSLRIGLDTDERDRREQVFGGNIIDIKQKSIPQILFEEVS
jgi:cation-transporting ATPase 13A3/4/5